MKELMLCNSNIGNTNYKAAQALITVIPAGITSSNQTTENQNNK